jgi:hypothetical protein
MARKSRTILLAATACLTLPALFAPSAVASTYERCDADGDHCVRVTCDRDGDECWRQSRYYNNGIYRHEGRWVCDSNGDRCHYQYNGRDRHEDKDHDR